MIREIFRRWNRPTKACACLFFLLTKPAFGAYFSGNELLEKEREFISYKEGRSYDHFETGFLFGYIGAIADSHPGLCLPKGATLGQLETVAYRYLDNHPERLHWSASVLVTQALTEAFPCK